MKSVGTGQLIVAFAALLFVGFARGTFLTDDELEKGVCHSAAAGFVSKISVQSVPTFPVDLLIIPGIFRKYLISCMKVYETGPVLPPSQIGLCSTPALLKICYSYVDSPTEWTCNEYPNYQDNPHADSYIGTMGEPEKRIKIQWIPQSSGILCFPRDLTFQFVGTAVIPEESNVAANVAFILIVVVVGVLGAFFLSYQLRKVLRKFWKKQKTRPATHLTTTEQQNTLKVLGRDGKQSPSRKRGIYPAHVDHAAVDLYDENATYSSGQQHAVINEGMTEIHAQPMPKPWFKRVDYDLSKKRLPGDEETPPSSARRTPGKEPESIVRSEGTDGRRLRYSETPHRQTAGNIYDDETGTPFGTSRADPRPAYPYGPSAGTDTSISYRNTNGPQRPISMYDVDTGRPAHGRRGPDYEEEDDIVLTCTDCLLPIRGKDTPPFCAVSGKRHY